jgi:glucose-6-phosphate isomerase
VKFALGRYEDAVRQRLDELLAAGAPGRIWQRDATFWGGDAARQTSVANRLGWLDVASRMRERADDLRRFAAQVRDDGFKDAVVLGMGGSSLAPEVLRRSIGASEGWPSLHVLDTTDPATIAAVQRQIDPARTLFIVSSKSGTTLEPLSLFAYFHNVVRATKANHSAENFVAITDPATPLEALARERTFRQVFTNPPDIGGRYSALSLFGLVPAAVSGVELAELLDRAIAAEHRARLPDSDALRLGAALGELARRGRDKATFIVSPSIGSFGLWVEQLIAESTGKLGRGILPVADEPLGSVRDYAADRVFVRVCLSAEDDGSAEKALAALEAAGHPSITVELADAYDLGGEFFRWEFAVAAAGRVLEINPFDEPNVQESKDNTNRVLKEFAASGKLDLDGIDSTTGVVAMISPERAVKGSLAQAMAELLAATTDCGYFAITAYIQQTEESDAAFRAIRAAVRASRGVSTTLGYGPRFLHSTGQLHKGGQPGGVFLQITQSDANDLPIPGVSYTFGQFKRAQAIGDLQSLVEHGSAVLRVHLGKDVSGGLHALRAAVEAATR